MTDMPEKTEASELSPTTPPQLGRNEPCHCGSGKKYKRCHGVGAAPKITPPKAPAFGGGEAGAEGSPAGGFPGGFDPSQMDPAMMRQFAQMLQRLPKGQLQKLQGIMQRAMSGKDVTRDAAEFERTLPVGLQEMMKNFASQMAGQAGTGAEAALPAASAPVAADGSAGAAGMTEEEARRIVAAAAAEGKISQDEAEKLLVPEEKKSGFAKFWPGKKS